MVTMVLALPYLRIIAFLKFHPRSLGLSSSFTQGPFLSNLVLDSVEVMASAHLSLPVTRSPWNQSVGGNVRQEVPSHWRSGLTTCSMTNDQRRVA